MALPDPRIHAYRNDIADARLKKRVEAVRYIQPKPWQVAVGRTALCKSPNGKAEELNELRFGDSIDVFEVRDGWAWGQLKRDGYVGYVKAAALSKKILKPTHRVSVPTTFLFSQPGIKACVLDTLTFFSAVTVAVESGDFFQLAGNEKTPVSFVHRRHLTAIKKWHEPDPVFIAGRFLNVPYLWGGVTPLGCDCSGLIQTALLASGLECPRDSDMQAASLGKKLKKGATLKHGDLVFFKGHVGIMADETMLLHANAYHGRVVVEPLKDVVKRGAKIIAARRI